MAEGPWLEEESTETTAGTSLKKRWAIMGACAVVGAIFLLADLLNVMVDYHAVPEPEPLTVSPNQLSDSALSSRRLDYGLRTLLRRPGDEIPEPTEEMAASAAPTPQVGQEESALGDAQPGDEEAPGTAAHLDALPGVELQGVMLGNGVGIAVIDVEGVSYAAAAGERAGDYTVDEVTSDTAVLSKNGQRWTIGLKSSSEPNYSASGGPPVLPDPDNVPAPQGPMPLNSASMASTARSSGVSRSAKTAYAEASAPLPQIVDVYGEKPSAKNSAADSFDSSWGEKPEGGASQSSARKLSRRDAEAFSAKGAALIRDIRGQEVAGESMGIKVKFLNPDNALSKLGLRDGDLVTKINNKSIYTSEDLFNSFIAMKDMPYISVSYKRGGQPGHIVYEFEE